MAEFQPGILPTRVRPGALLAAMALAFSLSCATRRHAAVFRVVAANPEYLLRWPDAAETPIPEMLAHYTNIGPDWVELRPEMELRVENAYYREGAPKRGLANYLGTQVARYRVLPNGRLRGISAESGLVQLPADQPPVKQLLPSRQARYSHHRYFYQVVLNRRTRVQSAILLGAASKDEIERLTGQLGSAPDSVCSAGSGHCTVFPEACTVALEMEIVVNGAPRTVPWGSFVASVASPQTVELSRPFAGRLVPVEMDASDPKALRLPLLPGDHIDWR